MVTSLEERSASHDEGLPKLVLHTPVVSCQVHALLLTPDHALRPPSVLLMLQAHPATNERLYSTTVGP